MPVAAIVLAAGASRRLGRPKQLLRLDGETLLARAIRLAGAAGASPLFAVLGANSEAVSASIQNCGARMVLNTQWEQGIATSIHAGMRALEAAAPHASGALLLGCDQPRLTAAHLRAMIATFAAHDGHCIVASEYAGVLGAPAVFPRGVFPHLYALHGDKGARTLLTQPPCSLIAIEFSGGEIDIDLPVDLDEIQ